LDTQGTKDFKNQSRNKGGGTLTLIILSSSPFSDMIEYMVSLGLLEVGQKLGAKIVSHW